MNNQNYMKNKNRRGAEPMETHSFKLSGDNLEDIRSGIMLLNKNGVKVSESEYVRRAIEEYSAYLINDRVRVKEYVENYIQTTIGYWDKGIVRIVDNIAYHLRVVEEMINYYANLKGDTPQQIGIANWKELRYKDDADLPKFARGISREYDFVEKYKEKTANIIKSDRSLIQVAELCVDFLGNESDDENEDKASSGGNKAQSEKKSKASNDTELDENILTKPVHYEKQNYFNEPNDDGPDELSEKETQEMLKQLFPDEYADK